MVFGLFGKRKDALSITEPERKSGSESVRSPSPTAASISEQIQPPQTPKEPQTAIDEDTSKSAPLSISNAGPSTDYDLPPSDPTELLSLLKKVPPKALYDYVVQHVPDASPQELSSLLEFFKSLTPPPKLHCVRCHKEFVEIENTDRSCHVAHDDESALVEKVGKAGTTYETLWGCCNRIVEGDGDQGPPDGWCYEGFHTTDIKRARFRADSTLQDDKLVSCKRMRCFNAEVGTGNRGRSGRASARKSLKEASDEEEDYDMHELVREAEILTGKGAANRGNKKKPAKPESVLVDKVADDLASISVARSKAKSKAGSVKPRSTAAKSTSSAADASTSMVSVRSEIRAGEDITMTTSPPAQEPVAQPKKKRRARKSAAVDGGRYKPSKSDEEVSESDEEPEKPRRKRTKRKSTVDNATVS